MPSMKKSQRAGGCGANSETKKMVGGSKSKKSMKSMKSSKKSKKYTGSLSGPDVGYCVKCHTKVTMLNPKDITKQTKKRLMKMRVGKCPKCGTAVHKITGGSR